MHARFFFLLTALLCNSSRIITSILAIRQRQARFTLQVASFPAKELADQFRDSSGKRGLKVPDLLDS